MAAADDKRISVDLTDDQGNVALTLFSTTGDRRSKADFEQAYAHYEKTGEAPSGFTALEPGMMSKLRKGFEAVNQPLQSALSAGGKYVGEELAAGPPGFSTVMQKLGLMSPESAQSQRDIGGRIGQTVGETVGSAVKTPEAAGLTVGMALAAPFLSPVSAIGKGGQVALSKMGLLSNALATGATGAAGGTLLPMAMGETPDFGKTAADFAVASISGGVSGFLNHFVTKYISPNMSQKVAGDIIDTIKKQYPDVASNPNLLNIYASNSTNLAKLTQNMSQALRGENKVVADTTYDALTQGFKGKLSVGEQNTMRGITRDYVNNATKLLDSIGDDEARAAANEAFLKSRQKIITYLEDVFTDPSKGINKAQALQDKTALTLLKFEKGMENSVQGAEVLSLLKQSGADKGFNPNAFVELVKNKYMQMQNPLLEQVGNAVGQGQSLIDIPTQKQASPVARTILEFVKNRVPVLKHIPLGDGPKLASPMNWQQPKAPLPQIVLGQQSGLAAMQEFFGRGRK